MSRTVAVSLALLSLTLAGSASAECAWVLWERVSERSAEKPWQALRGYGDGAACEQKLEQSIANLESRYPGSTRLRDGILLRGSWDGGKTTTVQIHEWRCLPDSVDPRGPKG